MARNGDGQRIAVAFGPEDGAVGSEKVNKLVEVKYFESDAAWFKRIRQELGSGTGRSPHWLVFNDEADHAYRRGDVAGEEQTFDEDKGLARKNAREATIWIGGSTGSTSWPGAAASAASASASIYPRPLSALLR